MTIVKDQVMHALELASEASKRAGKWATPPEVTAFGRTGEVGLHRIVSTNDLNALVREGRAESTIPGPRIYPHDITYMYRPQHTGGPAESKAKTSPRPEQPPGEPRGPRKPEQPEKPWSPWDEQPKKGPCGGLTTKELLGDVPGGSGAPGASIGGVGGAVGRQIL